MDLIWERYNDSIWETKIPVDNKFDQLFVNGQPQILARYPNYDESGGHWQGHAADAISPERIKNWEDPAGTIVHVMHRGEWGGFHYVISGVDNQGEPEFAGGHQNNRPSGMHEKYRMVENVFEELDNPGEWYLSEEGKLYYWPPVDVDVHSAEYEGVHIKHLVEVTGTDENPVSQIEISGIRFEHTRRTFMEDYEPLLRSDWTIYRGGAIYIQGSENISIKDNELLNLGGNGIFVSGFNRQVEINGNHEYDCR